MNNNNLVIENARITFRNFSGVGDKFNREGNRNFAVVIDDQDMAERLIKDGWNIKSFKPRDPDEITEHFLSVTVNLGGTTKVNMVTKKNILELDDNTISILDEADIENCDIIIRPYDWEVNGKEGRKAYLKTLYITISEYVFADKYDSGQPNNEPLEPLEYRR